MKPILPNGFEISSFGVTLLHFLENIRKNLVERDYEDSSGQYKILEQRNLLCI